MERGAQRVDDAHHGGLVDARDARDVRDGDAAPAGRDDGDDARKGGRVRFSELLRRGLEDQRRGLEGEAVLLLDGVRPAPRRVGPEPVRERLA